MSELYHFGIKGMKWGVRRTPEELGHIKNGRTTQELGYVKNVHESIGNISRETSSLVKNYDSMRNKKNVPDVSKLSDEELRKMVSRISLEKQYASLTAPELSKGAKRTTEILTLIGSLTAIGASATSMAIAIKKLKE